MMAWYGLLSLCADVPRSLQVQTKPLSGSRAVLGGASDLSVF